MAASGRLRLTTSHYRIAPLPTNPSSSQRQRETHELDGAAHGLVQNAPLRAAGLPAASLDATLHEARVAGRVARFNKQRFGPRCCVVGGLLDRQVIAVA